MKLRVFLPVVAVSVSVMAVTQAAVLEIAEVNEALTATLDGSPFPITITGPQNHWTVELPSGYAFADAIPGGAFDPTEFQLGEPEDFLTYNDIFITQPTFLTWDSDLPAPSGVILVNPVLQFNAGTVPGGGSFDLILADRLTTTPAPDGGSTFALCGVGMMVLAGLRSKIRQ